MSATLVTLPIAKLHLGIPADDTDHDLEVQVKLDQAEAIILRYLKAQADPTWTAATVPANVPTAMLLLLASLYEMRGDDQRLSEMTWTAIERLLRILRDPALA